MKKITLLITTIICLVCITGILVLGCSPFRISTWEVRDTSPVIFPDYTGIIIPPNIAPLNFRIREKGIAFQVVLVGASGDSLVVRSRGSIIRFPPRRWRNFINQCAGKHFVVKIFVREDWGWVQYKPFTNRVAREPVDRYLVYRLLNPGYEQWSDMGIYQRHLESFYESAIFTNKNRQYMCMNCHSFCDNDPAQMMFHVRGKHGGTLICRKGSVENINTKTEATIGAGAYPSWHPEGSLIAFSVNKVVQLFPSQPGWYIEVFDTASDLILYDCDKNTITTNQAVSTPQLENLPTWSPDGKYCYYCRVQRPSTGQLRLDSTSGVLGVEYTVGVFIPDSADYFSTGEDNIQVQRITQTRYDLMRISYDAESNTWGVPELVLSAKETGKSITFPRISPDGRFLMFCMSSFGYFTIHHGDADLYGMDLETRRFWPLDSVNSSATESFHSWSSNSRWFVFSSKRMDGIRARPFIGYFDKTGKTYKPFVVPQKNPDFYTTFYKTYNLPELVTGKVKVSKRVILDKLLKQARSARFVP